MLGSALGGAILGGGLYNQFTGGGAVQPQFTQPAAGGGGNYANAIQPGADSFWSPNYTGFNGGAFGAG